MGTFICDFMYRERMLVVEVDGGQHAESLKDENRAAYLKSQGYRVIRFWKNEVTGNLEGVIETIARALRLCPAPTPSRMREGKSCAAAKGWEP